VNGLYTFTAEIYPQDRIFQRADQMGIENVTLHVWFDMNLDGTPDAYAGDTRTIRQYSVLLLEDTGYSDRSPPEPEQVPWGLLAPFAYPIKARFFIDGPSFPVTVLFQSGSKGGGTGQISHAASQSVATPGVHIIDGLQGLGSGPGQVVGVMKSTVQNDCELDIRIGGSNPQEGIGWTIDLTIAEVREARWKEKFSQQLSENPGPGGGKRMFPGKESLADEENRRRIYIEAEIDPPVAGEIVWFRYLDVDDPSSTNSAIDPDDDATTRGADDNSVFSETRFVETPPKSPSGENGCALVELEVSLCPGDNYRAGTSFAKDYLDGVRVDESTDGNTLLDSNDDELDTILGKATDMLTIWRWLHIERDCMANASGHFLQGGHISELDSANQRATYSQSLRDGSNDRDSSPVGDGRFQGGRLLTLWAPAQSIAANGEFRLFAAASGGFGFQCQIRGGGQSSLSRWIKDLVPSADAAGRTRVGFDVAVPAAYEGGTIRLGSTEWTIDEVESGSIYVRNGLPVVIEVLSVWDDDNGSTQPEMPPTNILQDSDDPSVSVFARAYVRPKWDGGGNSSDNSNVAFQLNVAYSSAAILAQIYAGAGSSSAGRSPEDDFWQAYVQGAYQGGEAHDRDSDLEGPVHRGVAPSYGGYGGVVFRQVWQDHFEKDSRFNTWTPAQQQTRLARTTAHEIGHQFGLEDQPAGSGLMSSADMDENIDSELHLNDSDIYGIRSVPMSPGNR
jgi:hypothetical protein